MHRRWLALGIAVTSVAMAGACTLTASLDGYTGGAGKDAAAADSGASADTSTPIDSTTADSVVVDSAATDSTKSDTFTDSSTADTTVADAAVADTATADTAVVETTGDAGLGCHLVINELLTGRTSSLADEFVELFNPCPDSIAATGFKLHYRSSAGTTESTMVTLTGPVASGAYVLVASSGGVFSKTPYVADYTYSSGIAASGGLGLRDATGALVDSVTWGDAAAGHAFTEGTGPVPAPTTTSTGTSLARTPNGKDTNVNTADFTAATTITPKAAN